MRSSSVRSSSGMGVRVPKRPARPGIAGAATLSTMRKSRTSRVARLVRTSEPYRPSTHSLRLPEHTGEHRNQNAYRRIHMPTNTTQRDCSDQGCLAAMLGLEPEITDDAETD